MSATSTVLAVLTALISVITVGLPALVKSLSPNVSLINAAFVRTGSDYPDKYKFDYQIFISNSGNRPGALGEVWVRSDSPNTTDKIKLDIPEHYWPKDTEGIQKLEVLAPGESRSLYFSRRQTGAKLPVRAVVVVNVIEFDGTAKIIELPIPTKQALDQSG